jgi:hypothetical protein
MVLVLRILQMFISAPFTHLLMTGVTVVLATTLAMFNATLQKMLAGAKL